jgi:hypothetical protein
MSKDIFSLPEAQLVNFVGVLAAGVTANAVALGVPTTLATSNQTAADQFAAAYAVATDPATRTSAAISVKNSKKVLSVSSSRRVAAIIQANPAVTDSQKIDLGLRPHDLEPSPSHAPTTAPAVNVLSVFGRTARVRLTDPANPTKRGKPDFVAGAQVFTFVGEEPPADLSAWVQEGNTSRTALDLVFPTNIPAGAQVWITARWFGPRFQNGPTAAPITTNLPGGSAQAAA